MSSEPVDDAAAQPDAKPVDAAANTPAAREPSISVAPVMPEGRDARAGRLTMLVIRSLFMVLLVSVTLLTVSSRGNRTNGARMACRSRSRAAHGRVGRRGRAAASSDTVTQGGGQR